MTEFLSYLMDIPYRWITTVPYALPFVWAGAIIGHSFIATPAKFNAKGVERHHILEIGRETFSMFFFAEIFFLSLITATMVIAVVGSYVWFVFSLIGLSLFLQRYYLRPILFNAVDHSLENRPLPSKFHHRFYAFLEAFKFITLIGLGSLLITY